jgi:ATP/maltotriose-dependent transcriptional regulator MalT
MESKAAKGDFLPPFSGVSLSSITPPPANPNFILRSSLLAKMDHPAPHSMVLVAPSGFGKTSLAAQWAAEKPNNTIWVSLTENLLPTELAKTVISSIRRIIPNFAPWAESKFENDVDLISIITDISNELSSADDVFRTVWDGTDRLSEDLIPILQIFLDNTPSNLTTLSLCRRLPDISYAQTATMNAFTLFTAIDLKFTIEETKALAKASDLDIANFMVSKKLKLADGWPVGVQLLISHIKSNVLQLPLEIMDLSAQDKFIVSHVIEALDSYDREILESLIFFDEFNEDIVLEILQSIGAAKRMKELVNLGVFLYRVSENSNLFVMQPMVRDYLTAKMEQESVEFLDVGNKAAEILLRTNSPLKALAVYQKIGEKEKAFDLARRSLSELIFSANSDALQMFKHLIGDKLGIGPAGEVGIEIYSNVSIGKNETTKFDLDILESMIDGTEAALGAADEITLMRCRLAFTFGSFQDSIKLFWDAHHRKMEQLSGKVKGIPKYALTGIGPALDSAFLLDDTNSLWKMSDLILKSNIANNYAKNLNWLSSQALTAHSEGRFNDAYALGKSAIALAKTRTAGGAFLPYSSYYCVADSLREFGKEEEALEVIEEILSEALRYQQTPWVVAFYSRKALILSQLARLPESLQMIGNAREVASQTSIHLNMNQVIDENEILVRVISEDSSRIAELLSRMPDTSVALAFKMTSLAKQNLARAEKVLENYPEPSPRHSVVKKLIFAETFVSKPNIAIKYLDEALSVAAPLGMRQIFLQQSAEVKNHILVLASEKPTVYLQGIAGEIRNQVNRIQRGAKYGIYDPLTKREMEILRRLETGLPISKIATNLHISNNTIKTHLRNIYGKLNVESRDEAVTRGKELLLL